MKDDFQFLEDVCNEIEEDKEIDLIKNASSANLCSALTDKMMVLLYLNLNRQDFTFNKTEIVKIKNHLDKCYLCSEKYEDIEEGINYIKKLFDKCDSKLKKEFDDNYSIKIRNGLYDKIKEEIPEIKPEEIEKLRKIFDDFAEE